MAIYPQESIDTIVEYTVQKLVSDGHGPQGDKRIDIDVIDEQMADMFTEIRFAIAVSMGVELE